MTGYVYTITRLQGGIMILPDNEDINSFVDFFINELRKIHIGMN